mmetsp:Transcript_35133/g.69327  ORF Transcript_35133/g.69327 Transcript_35133/m.69327 type:complete len:109 (-) Transcript_35133:201-527(-)
MRGRKEKEEKKRRQTADKRRSTQVIPHSPMDGGGDDEMGSWQTEEVRTLQGEKKATMQGVWKKGKARVPDPFFCTLLLDVSQTGRLPRSLDVSSKSVCLFVCVGGASG